MIIVRSPLRISLGGGGTDLSSYYLKKSGFLIAAAIDKYVYVTINKPFSEGIYLKYSKSENVKKVNDVDHKIIREALMMQDYENPQIEITTLTDIPAGTGLGSSGSFTTALIRALYAYNKRHINQEQIAQMACEIEIDRLKEPIGKQDQYIASYGGISGFVFRKDDSVNCQPLNLSAKTIGLLEDNLLLFFTGFSRNASDILRNQKEKSVQNDDEMIKNLDITKEIGLKSKEFLENGQLDDFGFLMHEHWQHKKNRSPDMTNSYIDEWYNTGIQAGALGGKVVGAGGGGFLMFYTNDPQKLRDKMSEIRLEEVKFRFDFEGTKLIYS